MTTTGVTPAKPAEPVESAYHEWHGHGGHGHGGHGHGGGGGTVYAFGLIGAWVYYIGHATTLQEGAIGFLKGIVWPAFLVYNLLAYLDGKE